MNHVSQMEYIVLLKVSVLATKLKLHVIQVEQMEFVFLHHLKMILIMEHVH